jgi:hypothetical protein
MRHFPFQHLGFEPEPNETPRPPSSARKTVCFEIPVPPFRESPGHLLVHAPRDYRSPSVAWDAFPLLPATISHGNRLTSTRETCSAMAISRSSLPLSLFHLPSLVSSANIEEHRNQTEATEEHRKQRHGHWRVEMVMRKRESRELLSG